MNGIPETSTTLLRDVADSFDSPRWSEFVVRYRPMLELFMAERFPGLESDELVQDTFIAVAKALPDYRYVPEEKGHFRNFLTGILRNKALNALRSARRRTELLAKYALETEAAVPEKADDSEASWRKAICEIALQQLLADPNISARNKQIFIRTAIKTEQPEAVAVSLAVSRAVVDQTKKRMLDRLRKIVGALKKANGC